MTAGDMMRDRPPLDTTATELADATVLMEARQVDLCLSAAPGVSSPMAAPGRGGKQAFERILAYGNDLGLFAEEIDPTTGVALGNFPQAFTHIGPINAALALFECQGV